MCFNLRCMTKTIIDQVISINSYVLIVFYTSAHSWQFRVISPLGSIYGERKTYYSAQAAESAGRNWLKQV